MRYQKMHVGGERETIIIITSLGLTGIFRLIDRRFFHACVKFELFEWFCTGKRHAYKIQNQRVIVGIEFKV